MIVKLLWFAFLMLFNIIVAPVSTISRCRKENLFGTPTISDNGLPLLTENIFQTPPILFGPPLVYWYLGYLSDPLLLRTPPPHPPTPTPPTLLFGTGEYTGFLKLLRRLLTNCKVTKKFWREIMLIYELQKAFSFTIRMYHIMVLFVYKLIRQQSFFAFFLY